MGDCLLGLAEFEQRLSECQFKGRAPLAFVTVGLGAEKARRGGDDGLPFPLAVGVERGPDPFRALDDAGPNTAFSEDENPKNA